MKNSLLFFSFLLVMASCVKPVPRKPIVRKSSSFMKESVLLNKSLNAVEEKAIGEIIIQDSLSNYLASSHGFWYKYNLKSTNDKLPEFGDKLSYSYEVSDLNNALIYSEETIGEKTYLVDQQDIIEGLRNGLKLMNEGDIVTFLFPSHKVYGYLGDENKIGINQPLIYKVKLNKIKKNKINTKNEINNKNENN